VAWTDLRRAGGLVAALAVAALIAALAGTTTLAGDDGSAKVEVGPDGIVTIHGRGSFNVEGFGLIAGRVSWLSFSNHGGDTPTAYPGGWVRTDATGAFESVYFDLGPGDYVATLSGSEDGNDVQASSSIFTVRCDDGDDDESVGGSVG
jgi:hypothetical protein